MKFDSIIPTIFIALDQINVPNIKSPLSLSNYYQAKI